MRYKKHIIAALIAILTLALAIETNVFGLQKVRAEFGDQPFFVYGTLRSGVLRLVLTGSVIPSERAVLHDYERLGLTVIESEDNSTYGEIIFLSAKERANIDRYERVGQVYEKELVETSLGGAFIYVRKPSL